MSESQIMWMEIIFNVSYLVAIYALVVLMIRRQPHLSPKLQPVTKWIIWAFALLALGDTGHVGFRIWAYALGDMESTIPLFGAQVGLLGLGTVMTSITVTLFYAAILLAWQQRYQKTLGWFEYILLGAAVVRLLIMTLPQNEWNSIVSPYPFGVYRNIPLVVSGLGAAYLLFRDAGKRKDKAFINTAWCILVSFAFYIPVIFFIHQVPLLGMLMIPKTLAYVAIAWIAYKHLFKLPLKKGAPAPVG